MDRLSLLHTNNALVSRALHRDNDQIHGPRRDPALRPALQCVRNVFAYWDIELGECHVLNKAKKKSQLVLGAAGPRSGALYEPPDVVRTLPVRPRHMRPLAAACIFCVGAPLARAGKCDRAGVRFWMHAPKPLPTCRSTALCQPTHFHKLERLMVTV